MKKEAAPKVLEDDSGLCGFPVKQTGSYCQNFITGFYQGLSHAVLYILEPSQAMWVWQASEGPVFCHLELDCSQLRLSPNKVRA